MKISVVIPALDEAAWIVAAVESACDRTPRESRAEDHGGDASGPVEVLVVDGGSRDQTRRLAREAGARVFSLPGGPGHARGRAAQLDLGSRAAQGQILLFLHADTRLEPGWSSEVEKLMSDPGVAGGAFTFQFLERGKWERWVQWWVGVRVALLGLPYGDQALFVRREVLEQMGGIPNVPIMEDLDLVRGIRRAGRLGRLPLRAMTSSRRYRARGFRRTLLWHQVALLGWFLGWDRERLAARMGR